MIPFILAAVGGYLIYDSTRKAPNPLSNPYNILADGGEIRTLWLIKDNDAEMLMKGTSRSIKTFLTKEKKKSSRGEKSVYGLGGLEEWYENTTKEQVLKHNRNYSSTDQSYAQGGKVGRFKILQDETGYVEQGFYGVFDTDNNELLDIFEFKKEAEGFVKELNDKGISEADASKFNGRIENYVLKNGGKVKSKKWIQEALSGGKNKGALRRTAKKKGLLRGDENLSATDLKKLQKMGGTTAKRAHLAETLRKLK